MKILVLSDTHGLISNSYINEIKEINGIDLLIHVGDYTKDAKEIANLLKLDFVNVKGNCDYRDMSTEEVLELELEGKNFFIIHGNQFGVKKSNNLLECEAKKRKADIVIYGHTHDPYNKIIDDILYFNPGSPTCPKENNYRSFGIIEIIGDKINSQVIYF